jgi:hypothetical protein
MDPSLIHIGPGVIPSRETRAHTHTHTESNMANRRIDAWPQKNTSFSIKQVKENFYQGLWSDTKILEVPF